MKRFLISLLLIALAGLWPAFSQVLREEDITVWKDIVYAVADEGEKDAMVVIGQSEILYEAMEKAGVPTTFVRVKNATHMYRPYK